MKDLARRMMRGCAILLTALVVLNSAALAKAPPVCTGTNVFAELEAANSPLAADANAIAATFPNDGAVLWRLTKGDAPPSYLFGTIHVTHPSVATLAPDVKRAISDVKQVAVEIRSDESERQMISLMSTRPELFFDQSQTLKSSLAPEQFKRLKDYINQPLMPLEQLRPWMVSLMMAYTPCERNRIEAKVPVLDEAVEREARAAGATLNSLETVGDQSNALAGIPVKDQIAIVRSDLAVIDRADDMAATMVALYNERRVSHVWAMTLVMAKKNGIAPRHFESFKTAMLDKRNARMLTRAQELIAKAPTFVAVGALHLVGTEGLVAGFRAAGFTVEPIPFDPVTP